MCLVFHPKTREEAKRLIPGFLLACHRIHGSEYFRQQTRKAINEKDLFLIDDIRQIVCHHNFKDIAFLRQADPQELPGFLLFAQPNEKAKILEAIFSIVISGVRVSDMLGRISCPAPAVVASLDRILLHDRFHSANEIFIDINDPFGTVSDLSGGNIPNLTTNYFYQLILKQISFMFLGQIIL